MIPKPTSHHVFTGKHSAKVAQPDASKPDTSMMSLAKSIANERGEQDSLSQEYVYRRMEQKQRMNINKSISGGAHKEKLNNFYTHQMGGVYNPKQLATMYGVYQDAGEGKKMFETTRPMDLNKGDFVHNNRIGEIGVLQDNQDRGSDCILIFQDRSFRVNKAEQGWNKKNVETSEEAIQSSAPPTGATSAANGALFKEHIDESQKNNPKPPIDIQATMRKIQHEVNHQDNAHAPKNDLEKGKEMEREEHAATFQRIADENPPVSKAAEWVAKDHLKENSKYYSNVRPGEKEMLISQDASIDDYKWEKIGKQSKPRPTPVDKPLIATLAKVSGRNYAPMPPKTEDKSPFGDYSTHKNAAEAAKAPKPYVDHTKPTESKSAVAIAKAEPKKEEPYKSPLNKEGHAIMKEGLKNMNTSASGEPVTQHISSVKKDDKYVAPPSVVSVKDNKVPSGYTGSKNEEGKINFAVPKKEIKPVDPVPRYKDSMGKAPERIFPTSDIQSSIEKHASENKIPAGSGVHWGMKNEKGDITHAGHGTIRENRSPDQPFLKSHDLPTGTTGSQEFHPKHTPIGHIAKMFEGQPEHEFNIGEKKGFVKYLPKGGASKDIHEAQMKSAPLESQKADAHHIYHHENYKQNLSSEHEELNMLHQKLAEVKANERTHQTTIDKHEQAIHNKKVDIAHTERGMDMMKEMEGVHKAKSGMSMEATIPQSHMDKMATAHTEEKLRVSDIPHASPIVHGAGTHQTFNTPDEKNRIMSGFSPNVGVKREGTNIEHTAAQKQANEVYNFNRSALQMTQSHHKDGKIKVGPNPHNVKESESFMHKRNTQVRLVHHIGDSETLASNFVPAHKLPGEVSRFVDKVRQKTGDQSFQAHQIDYMHARTAGLTTGHGQPESAYTKGLSSKGFYQAKHKMGELGPMANIPRLSKHNDRNMDANVTAHILPINMHPQDIVKKSTEGTYGGTKAGNIASHNLGIQTPTSKPGPLREQAAMKKEINMGPYPASGPLKEHIPPAPKMNTEIKEQPSFEGKFGKVYGQKKPD